MEFESIIYVRRAADILSQMKTSDIVILDLRKVCSFTDYFLICSCESNRQVKAVCEEISKVFKTDKVFPLHIEGYTDGNWVIVDYCDFIVHIFLEETRNYYLIERLWSDAPRITIPGINDDE